MPPDRGRCHWRLPVLAALLCALGGCQALGELRLPRAATRGAQADAAQAAASLVRLLEARQRLALGSPAEQAEILAAARQDWSAGQRPAAALRYGMLLAVPGHAGRDAGQARQRLLEALAAPEQLSAAERALALVEQQQLEREARDTGQGLKQQAALQAEREAAVSAAAVAARRLRAEQDEVAKLRKALEEARAKLEAIASIERGASPRPAPAEGRKP
ncbi:MAG: hypothetical protein RL026_198 [Pseudomonadota bacterium]